MIEQQLYFAPVYLAEALTVGLFFDSLFSAKRSALGRWSTFFVCYGAAWLLFSLDTVQINVFVFAAGTALSLYTGYRVSIRKTFFYAVLLSALMLGTEYLSMIFLSFFWVIFPHIRIKSPR